MTAQQSDAKSVLVVGDVMLDRWVRGSVSRVSPEAPTVILREDAVMESPGGAANVAANLCALGAVPVWLLGVVGADGPGAALCAATAPLVAFHRLCVAGAGITTVKTRFVAGSQALLRVDRECSELSADADISAALAGLGTPGPSLLLVADYDKGAMTPVVRECAAAQCSAFAAPLWVDTKYPELYPRASLIKLNYPEALAWASREGFVHPALYSAAPLDALETISREMFRRLAVPQIVITAGQFGAVSRTTLEGFTCVVPASPQAVCNVTGAGDTFFAAMAVSWLEGRATQMLEDATFAAGLAVATAGTACVSRKDWDAARRRAAGAEGKHMPSAAALAFVQQCRADGLRVVLANGCFDRLHPGHVEMLLWAKSRGDILVVAYNDDASVRALKGAGRPYVPEETRGRHLAQLACVDCVFPFAEEDAAPVVQRFQPDILVKAEEYREKRVAGADYVAKRGGLVLFAPMFGTAHTTDLLQGEQ